MPLGQNIQDLVIPSDPNSLVERPLDKGMLLHVPPQLIPPGGLLEAKNLIVTQGGLKRRPGSLQFAGDLKVQYPPIQDMVVFWKTDGGQNFLVLDQKLLYLVTPGSYNPVYNPVTIGTDTVSVSGTTVTGVGTAFVADNVLSGDIITLDADGSGDGPEVGIVASITDDTHLELEVAPTGTYGAGTDFVLYRTWQALQPLLLDWTVISGGEPAVVFADGGRHLYYFDGSVLGNFNEYSSPAKTNTFQPTCVCYFGDRIWCGNIQDAGVNVKQRIQWSAPGLFNDFTGTGSGFLDLPYTQGAIKRLVPLGDFLIAYFDDAVFIGRPTNIVGLPMAFKQLETGGIGLLGPRAVCKWLDSHYFVGQDDIYLLSPRGLESIGTPVVKRTIKHMSSGRHWMIHAAADPVNDRIVFGFPFNSNEMEELWSYNYRTKAWSWEDRNCWALGSNTFADTKTWEDFVVQDVSTGTVATTIADQTLTADTGSPAWLTTVQAGDVVLLDQDEDGNFEFVTTVQSVTDNFHLEMEDAAVATLSGKAYRIVRSERSWEGSQLNTYVTWEAIRSPQTTAKDLYFGTYDVLWYFAQDQGGDGPLQTGISCQIVTRDMDFDLPDEDKFYAQLSVKLEEPATADLSLVVTGSTDRGQNWKSLGTLVIPAGLDEGKVTFRMTGSIARFRLDGSPVSFVYTMNELVVRVRRRGREVPGRSDLP